MSTWPISDGERVVRCLAGQPIDRTPFGVGLGWHPWGSTLQRWRQEAGIADSEPFDYGGMLGYDRSFISPALNEGIWPPFEVQMLEDRGSTIVYRDERGITIRALKQGESIPEYLDYPVKTPDDWKRLKAERLQVDTPGRIPQDWEVFRQQVADTGDAVQVGRFPYGVFGAARDLMGAEELLVAFYDEPEMVQDMMEHLTTLWIALWERVADEVQIDHLHIWEDMSGRQGSLISPAMVERFMMPCYDRMVDFARRRGIRVISVDSDGDCSELVRVMSAHGVNMFFPFEVQAGNDIRVFRERYPELGIMGGLDKRALARGRDAIDREIEKAAWMVERGRYIPMFDHLIPPDVPWEHLVYAAERIRALCGKS